VDINPMAVELCKVTLWLEALEPGKPLSFLDHHIRCGNSLLGATPELIASGLPDEAFDPIEGDDKAACSSLKKLNRAQREGLRHLFIAEDNAIRDRLHQTAAAIDEMSDSRPEDIQRKEAAFRAEQSNYDFQKAWDLADLWCASFVIKKRFPVPASAISGLVAKPGPSLVSEPLALQGGLFGDTEELPKAKGKKAKAPRRADSDNAFGITTQHLRDFVESGALPAGLLPEARQLASQYQFFHWHLAFPEVFAHGGFDVNLGNPPWERVNIQEAEWFTEWRPDIASAPNVTARKRLIARLVDEDPKLHIAYSEAIRHSEGEGHVLRNSGLYPLCARGDINLYAVFAEGIRNHLKKTGRAGVVLPSGIATDENTKLFFRAVIDSCSLISLFDFENRAGLFPAVDSRMKFCLFTLGGAPGSSALGAEFVFFAHRPEQLGDQERRFTLSAEDIALLNPNTRTCPVFRFRCDAEMTKAVFRRVPVFQIESDDRQNPWEIVLSRMFHMGDDCHLFRTAEQLLADGWQPTGNVFVRGADRYVPLLEAKMIHHYDHRWGIMDGANTRSPTIDEKRDPNHLLRPRYWLPEKEVREKVSGKARREWLLGWRDITNTTNERTVISTILPLLGCGDTLLLMWPQIADGRIVSCLNGSLASLVFDYFARQKIGGTHLKYHIFRQLPVLPPSAYAEPSLWTGRSPTIVRDWLLPRVLEMTYTTWDLEPFAQDCGWSGPPFRWDGDRRFLLRCELDAAFFHLYLGMEDAWREQPAALTQSFPTPRDAVSHIMDTFPIVKRKDEEKFNGDYRTKRTILEIYDALQESIQTGTPYQTRLPIPAADVRVAHEPRWPTAVRPTLEPLLYFQCVLPLMLRLQPGGIERNRLLLALELLTETDVRKVAGAGGAFSQKWSEQFPKRFSFSDAAGVLLALLRDGTLHGVDKITLDPTAKVPTRDAWLELDAFAALRLAMELGPEALQRTKTSQTETIAKIIRLAA
jgi:hypothetical protein